MATKKVNTRTKKTATEQPKKLSKGWLESLKTQGTIIFEEKEKNINKYKQHIGLLPQDLAIYLDFTARENINFFCSLYGYKGRELKERVDKALEFVGLTEVKNKNT